MAKELIDVVITIAHTIETDPDETGKTTRAASTQVFRGEFDGVPEDFEWHLRTFNWVEFSQMRSE